MSFRKLLNLFETFDKEQLDEALGPLANLKAGDLINVFKQSGGREDANKFNKIWGGGLGQSSDQIDIGKIKSWKDLRKAMGRDNEKSVIGAVFYVDGTAFAALNLASATDNPLYRPTADAMLAFDPTKLPQQEELTPPEGLSAWELNRWKESNRLPAPTARTKTNWQDKVQKFTGRSIRVNELSRYVDEVIALYPNSTFTCVTLTADKVGVEKQRERRDASQRNDELSRREDELSRYFNPDRSSLNAALDKYKASKNFNSFNEPNELIDYLSDVGNYGQEFVYKGNRYKYQLYTSDKLSFTADHLILNRPFEFSIDYRAASKDRYDRVTVKYRYENGQVTPISVNK